ncbi:DUF7782 domain-containing protein [Corynebacterium sp. 335C]
MNDERAYPPPPTDDALSGLPDLAPDLAAALAAAGFGSAGLAELLGDEGLAALDRGEPEAVAALLDGSPLARLVSAVVVGDPAPVRDVLGADVHDRAVACGVLVPADDVAGAGDVAKPGDAGGDAGGGRNDGADGDAGGGLGPAVVAAIDVRPLALHGRDHLVFSDRDASMRPHVPGADHVPGVGRASRSLLDITPHDPVGSVLDLGCGGGVQALGQVGAGTIVATDLHPRALTYARATLAAAGRADAEVLEGSWFEPVAGREFDRIVANPPFVVGPPEVGHVYRDSGLDLDGATATMIVGAVEHLAPGGTAHMLGAWVVGDGGDWRSRVASWIPDEGVEAWIVQRDVADPAPYVGTWLRDESADPRSAEGRARTRRWLEHFAAAGVRGVGFGYVTLQRIDGPSSVLCEEMPQPLAGPFALEAEEHLARAAWLRDKSADDIAGSVFRLRPGLALERVSLPDASGVGFAEEIVRVTRTDGPRWSHEIDDAVAGLLSSFQEGATLRLLVDLRVELGAWGDPGDDPDAVKEEILSAAVPVVVDLVRHGLVLPEEMTAGDAPAETEEDA